MGLALQAPLAARNDGGDGLFARCQQVALGGKVVLLEQSIHRVRLIFQRSISKDMLHLHALRVECPGNE